MADPIHDKLEEIRREVREGNASLQNRHDQHDKDFVWMHHKMDRLREWLLGVWRAIADVFKALIGK